MIERVGRWCLGFLATRRARLAIGLLALSLVALMAMGVPKHTPMATPSATAENDTPLVATQTATVQVFLPVASSTIGITYYLPLAGQGRITVAEATPTPVPARPSPTQVAKAPTKSVPKPTKVPEPTRGAPVPITKVTKMGIGVYGLHASNGELDVLLRAQPTIILLTDPNIGFARDVRYYFPNAFIIGRTFLASQPLDNPEQRGVALADKVAELAVPRKGLVDAWMSYNEPVAHDDYAGYEAYNRLQVAFAQRLQGHYGIPAVAGNDAPGAVEPEDYPKYFGEAIRASQYFGIHAYGKPDTLTLRTSDAAYYALRYRLIHEQLEAAGIQDVKMVVTEAGLARGWRYTVKPEDMAADFMWLADEMEKDSYMMGMAIYGAFTGGGVSGWQDFDIKHTRLPDLLGQYQPKR